MKSLKSTPGISKHFKCSYFEHSPLRTVFVHVRIRFTIVILLLHMCIITVIRMQIMVAGLCELILFQSCITIFVWTCSIILLIFIWMRLDCKGKSMRFTQIMTNICISFSTYSFSQASSYSWLRAINFLTECYDARRFCSSMLTDRTHACEFR